MTEPIQPEIVEGRETEDLRPVPPGTPGVHWNAMRIGQPVSSPRATMIPAIK